MVLRGLLYINILIKVICIKVYFKVTKILIIYSTYNLAVWRSKKLIYSPINCYLTNFINSQNLFQNLKQTYNMSLYCSCEDLSFSSTSSIMMFHFSSQTKKNIFMTKENSIRENPKQDSCFFVVIFSFSLEGSVFNISNSQICSRRSYKDSSIRSIQMLRYEEKIESFRSEFKASFERIFKKIFVYELFNRKKNIGKKTKQIYINISG